jgi:UDP-galactopyranose mutase
MEALMNVDTAVLGGGLTGLSAGHHLQAAGSREFVILERNAEVGGLARTEVYDGFSFDHSIHILYTDDEYAASWIRDDLPAGELNKQDRRSYCHSKGVECADGSSFNYQRLVSTLPLPALVELLQDAPDDIRDAAARLHSNVVHTVNIGLRGSIGSEQERMHWVYVPDPDVIFHPISFPHEFSASMTPPGCASIQAEISESPYRPVDRTNVVAKTLAGLSRMGLLTESEILPSFEGGRVELTEVVTLDPAYVIYDRWHDATTSLLVEWLRERDVEMRRRFGEWEYFNVDHSLLSGKAAAEAGLLATR